MEVFCQSLCDYDHFSSVDLDFKLQEAFPHDDLRSRVMKECLSFIAQNYTLIRKEKSSSEMHLRKQVMSHRTPLRSRQRFVCSKESREVEIREIRSKIADCSIGVEAAEEDKGGLLRAESPPKIASEMRRFSRLPRGGHLIRKATPNPYSSIYDTQRVTSWSGADQIQSRSDVSEMTRPTKIGTHVIHQTRSRPSSSFVDYVHKL